MALPDYYAVLDVPQDADLEQIKSSYRRLARLFHPDVNRHLQDSYMKIINEAYAVLSDPLRRAAYDIQLLEEKKRNSILELIIQQREQARHAQKRMTWAEGTKGFVRGFKRGIRGEGLS